MRSARTPADDEPTDAGAAVSFRRVIAALVGYGALSQALVLTGAFRANPYTSAPVLDARHYWEWAGRIADGQLVQATPFYSAPLYPHLLGVLRALGGGLAAAAALNAVLLVAAACLVAVAGRRLFGARVGAFAGATLLITSDVALETWQVLGGTLQVCLVALVLERASALCRTRPQRGAASLGLAAGLATLAWPALAPGVGVLALFAGLRAGLRAAAACLAVAVVTVSPATWHNYVASGELIPVSAHGGLTFWHGNNPAATGVIAIYGVDAVKDTYHLDALRQTRAARGPEAGWRDVSRHFYAQGLAWWAADPLHAAGVALRKLWYTLSSRVFADVHPRALEARDGLVPYGALAPLSLAVLMPVGLVAACFLLRARPVRYLPLALFVALPVAVCVAFWYTPRYRLPAAPAIALGAAVAVGWLASKPVGAARKALVVGALLLGAGSGALNRALGFDAPDTLERVHLERTATAYGTRGQHERAAALLQRALEREPADADLRRRVFLLLAGLGRGADALAVLDEAPPDTARDPEFRTFLAWTLATSPEAAARDGRRALALAQGVLAEPERASDPAVLDVLAAAHAELEDWPAALEAVEAALRWTTPADPLRGELAVRRDAYRARRPWREAPVTLAPTLAGEGARP